jgi:hypothetical protein
MRIQLVEPSPISRNYPSTSVTIEDPLVHTGTCKAGMKYEADFKRVNA